MRREFGWPLTELGNIRLRRGDLEGAEEAFVAAHEHSWMPQPGLAMLRLLQGDVDTAAALITDAIENPFDVPSKERPPYGGLRKAPLLDAQVAIAVAAGDVNTARRAADELLGIADTYRSAALLAGAAFAQGRTALAEGDCRRAIVECERALASWIELGAPFEAAVVRMTLGEARQHAGNDEGARMEWAAARHAFEEFGANGWADRAAQAVTVSAGPPAPPTEACELRLSLRRRHSNRHLRGPDGADPRPRRVALPRASPCRTKPGVPRRWTWSRSNEALCPHRVTSTSRPAPRTRDMPAATSTARHARHTAVVLVEIDEDIEDATLRQRPGTDRARRGGSRVLDQRTVACRRARRTAEAGPVHLGTSPDERHPLPALRDHSHRRAPPGARPAPTASSLHRHLLRLPARSPAACTVGGLNLSARRWPITVGGIGSSSRSASSAFSPGPATWSASRCWRRPRLTWRCPGKASALARLFDTGHNRKADAHDAHAVAVVAVRTPKLRVLAHDRAGRAIPGVETSLWGRSQGAWFC